jgi:hypothetical protein
MGSKPKPPDPGAGIPAAREVSDIQQGYNIGAQAGSNANQSNPLGYGQWIQTGVGPNGVPTYTFQSGFSPGQQGLYDINQASKYFAGLSGTGLLQNADYGSKSPQDAIGDTAHGITGGVINNELSYMQPFQTMERTQLDAKLRNQGFTPGTDAYNNAMRQMDTAHSMALAKLVGDTTAQAYGIGTNLYTLPGQMAMALGNYSQPINPNQMFGQTAQLQPANMTGAFNTTTDAAMKQYQAMMQQYSAGLSGMMGIPTALLGGFASSPAGGAMIAGML